jgi:nucleoside-diphosphate-sugar epimerase
MNNLVCFGFGYSAREFARRKIAQGWQVIGTTRSEQRAQILRADGFQSAVFTGAKPADDLRTMIAHATHVLVSTAPDDAGDPVLIHHGEDLATASEIEWIGYLSTVGVYGDHGGGWVDESGPLHPKSKRSRLRVAAEQAWLEFAKSTGKTVQLFRLAGIYGPGRGPLENVLADKARRIVKPGQVFNRIHVEDIANVLEASVAHPKAGGIYNVCDDEPAPPQDVVAYACEQAGVEPPPEIPFEDAELSPMGRSFYGENKRVSNALIKSELGVRLDYPTFREGIASLLQTRTRA